MALVALSTSVSESEKGILESSQVSVVSEIGEVPKSGGVVALAEGPAGGFLSDSPGLLAPDFLSF